MNCDLRLATLTTPAVKAGVARARLLSCRFQTRLLFSHGCRQRCRNGEAEQRGQAEAAAAFQGRTICHPLGFYSSRDLPGSRFYARGNRGIEQFCSSLKATQLSNGGAMNSSSGPPRPILLTTMLYCGNLKVVSCLL
ncbi:mitochondrial import receptor subunit TOM7 homolog isoform X2 [Bubalus bubalis]|uniref:mitochondrial import receptor subunit TOM7 homolog isoform X2 n=1 Tax=Bubalus bubalis TaxID=89462 RepID=UPI001D108150|nr:mitochondrial import receptor subunit TOM7 homolog isoform X2 [Bubalus bubalis]